MSNEKNNKDNIIKSTTDEANDLLHKTVDTSNKIVKSVSGEGGLVGKTADASSRVIKSVSDTSNKAINKTVDSSSKVAKGISKKIFSRNKKDSNE
jgi:ABC-type transporter Mla subunit MlaD